MIPARPLSLPLLLLLPGLLLLVPRAAGASTPSRAGRPAQGDKLPVDLVGREVSWRGQKSCEIRGRAATLDLLLVSPPGAASFRLAIAGLPATVHLAPPTDARAMHHAAVAG